jgi:hypothetical protein
VAMGGGERGRRRGEESAAQRLAPFEAEVGEGAVPRGGANGAERGGGRVQRHGQAWHGHGASGPLQQRRARCE